MAGREGCLSASPTATYTPARRSSETPVAFDRRPTGHMMGHKVNRTINPNSTAQGEVLVPRFRGDSLPACPAGLEARPTISNWQAVHSPTVRHGFKHTLAGQVHGGGPRQLTGFATPSQHVASVGDHFL